MLAIQQDSFNLGNLINLLSKYGDTSLSINQELLEDDITKLNKSLESGKLNKTEKTSTLAIINYLQKIKKSLDFEGKLNFTWMYDRYKIFAYPIQIKNYEPFHIRPTDYIEIGKSSLVKIDYKDIFEVIALDMIYRELGEDFQSMEEKLSGIGLATVYPVEKLLSLFDESPLYLSKILRIGDSPYATLDGKISWDYFNTAATCGEDGFTSGRYKDCVDRSIDVACLLITRMIIERCVENNLDFKVCAIGEDGFYLIIDDISDIDLNKVFDTVVVRAFGRKFEVVPKFSVF